MTFGELQEVILKNINIFKDKYNVDIFERQLIAIRVLRNKVSHHNFLFAEKYAECITQDGCGSTLRDNIINVQTLLPADFRQGFATSINNCAYELCLTTKKIII